MPPSAHRHASLIEVLSELSTNGVCEASQVRDALEERYPECFEQPGCKKFKNLVLLAQSEGAPVEWIKNAGSGAVRLTLDTASVEKSDALKSYASDSDDSELKMVTVSQLHAHAAD